MCWKPSCLVPDVILSSFMFTLHIARLSNIKEGASYVRGPRVSRSCCRAVAKDSRLSPVSDWDFGFIRICSFSLHFVLNTLFTGLSSLPLLQPLPPPMPLPLLSVLLPGLPSFPGYATFLSHASDLILRIYIYIRP